MKKISLYSVLLFGIFIAYCFLRFWNIHNRIIFDWDQEQFSQQIYDILVNKKFSLLGPRVTDDYGFFLAPYFTYLLVPLYIAMRLDPAALILLIIVQALLFFGVAWFVVTKLFGKWSALLFLLFWTASNFFVKYDVIPWWPLTLPIGVMLVLYTLSKIIQNNSIRWWVLLGVLFGFFINMHFQFAFIIAFSFFFLVIWAFTTKQKFVPLLLRIVVLLTSMAALFLPLLLFDVRHNFLNTTLFVRFFTSPHGPRDYLVWQLVLANAFTQFTHISNTLLMWVMYVVFVAVGIRGYKKSGEFKKYWFGAYTALILILPVAFIFYGKRPSEYYFLVYMPLIYIALADFLAQKNMRYAAIFVSVVFILINIATYKGELSTTKRGMAAKKMVIAEIQKNIGTQKKYAIAFDGPPNTDTGFRYLIKVTAPNIYADNAEYPLIQVRIPAQKNDIVVNEYGIAIPKHQ